MLGRVPTLIWRLLLFLLLVRIWPPVYSFALVMVRQPELLPSTVNVAVVVVILLLTTIAFFSSRRLVGWLFVAALWLWLLQPQLLPRQLLIGQSEGATIATLILGLPEQLLTLALMALLVGPILFLVLYYMRLTTAAGMDRKPTEVWRKFVPPVLLVAALAILADLLLTTGGFSGWLSPHSFGMLQLDITNLAVLTELPWLAASMVPPVLLFGLLLFIVDQWLRRSEGETV